MTSIQPIITLPLSGLPEHCGSCGEAPADGRWPLGVYGHRLNVTCPACFAVVASVRAVAATGPDCGHPR